MAERTCSERGCKEKPYCRGLCASHYGKAYRSGTLQLLLTEGPRHSLSEVDEEERTAICSVCGPVEIKTRATRSPECIKVFRERRARWNETRKNSPTRRRDPQTQYRRDRLKRKYGITLEDYRQMFSAQGGACAICQEPADKLSVDHDHATGVVRGLLCRQCNIGLGFMRDNPALLQSAINYLAAVPDARAS